MTGAAIHRMGSEVSVSLLGVGSHLPDRRVSNQEILGYLRPTRPDGRPLEPERVVEHLGIRERRLDYGNETSPDVGLVSDPGGGCLHHTSESNVADQVFLMDFVKMAEVFPPLMTRDLQPLQEDWPIAIQPFRHGGPRPVESACSRPRCYAAVVL